MLSSPRILSSFIGILNRIIINHILHHRRHSCQKVFLGIPLHKHILWYSNNIQRVDIESNFEDFFFFFEVGIRNGAKISKEFIQHTLLSSYTNNLSNLLDLSYRQMVIHSERSSTRPTLNWLKHIHSYKIVSIQCTTGPYPARTNVLVL